MRLSFIHLFGSCVKNTAFYDECPVHGTRIALSLSEIKEVETRGVASDNEWVISDTHVLVFEVSTDTMSVVCV